MLFFRKKESASQANMKIIAGLGNPGGEYEFTRHNLGFLTVTRLAEQHHLKLRKSSFTNGLTAEGEWDGHPFSLLMPLTYMNKSGYAVRQALTHYGAANTSLLVVCDDLNLPYRRMRLRPNGSDGGNNGLKSIISQLDSKEFSRLRMGIGRPASGDENVDFVLGEFDVREKEELPNFIKEATECCGVWLKEGIEKAMDQFNQRKENGTK